MRTRSAKTAPWIGTVSDLRVYGNPVSMTYRVTARKWRPQIFSEVVYQDHISKTLQNSIISGRISHAYLFSGPRGVGKTTMARILAKALNCKEGPTPHPCGVCVNCVEIRSGNSFDVIEIDGASNNGVDDIRDLREKVNFAPVNSAYKVYIIDEVHMVTTQAFNALLKTLEEPPPRVVFIFATTEIHRIPDTILSRCQKYFFKTIPAEHVVEHLRHIVANEGFNVSDRALYPIARAAQGSMRDAQSLLDQVISFSGRAGEGDAGGAEIGEQDALSLLGIVPAESYCLLLERIAGGDAAGVIKETDRVVSLGADIPRYVDGLLEMIRALRMLVHRVPVREILGLSADETAMLEGLGTSFSDEELGMIFRIADELRRNLRFSGNERVNLEMALLDMAAVKSIPTITAILKMLGGPGPAGGAAPERQGSVKNTAERGGGKSTAPVKPVELREAWGIMMDAIREEKQYLHLVVKPASVTFERDIVHLSYPGGDDHSYYEKILDGKNHRFLEERLSALTGRKIAVAVTPPEAGVLADEGAPASQNAPEDGLSAPPPESRMVKNPEADDYVTKNPAVEKIKNTFHGQIVGKGDRDA